MCDMPIALNPTQKVSFRFCGVVRVMPPDPGTRPQNYKASSQPSKIPFLLHTYLVGFNAIKKAFELNNFLHCTARRRGSWRSLGGYTGAIFAFPSFH
jgi:hypothetical protein